MNDWEIIGIVLVFLVLLTVALYSMRVEPASGGIVTGYVDSKTGVHVYSVNVSDSAKIKGGA